MKIAVFSDVHGNFINLSSFFENAQMLGVDKFICLGDLCNYYPDNIKVIALMRAHDIDCVLGNHDELYLPGKTLSTEKKSAYNFDDQLLLSKESIDFLKGLPSKRELHINNKSILFCHGSPADLLNGYVYPDTDLAVFNSISYDIVFMGHTHRQFLRTENNKVFCNVGSIGLPRDNGALMGFAIFDTAKMQIVLYRKQIDLKKVKKAYEDKVNADVMNLMTRKEILKYSFTLL